MRLAPAYYIVLLYKLNKKLLICIPYWQNKFSKYFYNKQLNKKYLVCNKNRYLYQSTYNISTHKIEMY